MSTINDGGPAFPSDYIPGTATTPGMTLRDYFAGQALAGMLADPGCNGSSGAIAISAYDLADAMLAAREGKP